MFETGDVRGLVASLAELRAEVSDAERIERIRLLSELASAAAAARATEVARFASSQRAAQLAAGVPAERAGRGIASQVGLAMRVSPHRAQRYVGWSTVLTRELPRTFAALQAGRTSEWRAMLVARETIWLSRENRALVDAEIGPHLEKLGDRRVEADVKRAGYRLDPEGFVARSAAAAADRNVSLRPAPDAMARLSALLPVAQGVAAYAALLRAADTARATGDPTSANTVPRGRGQLMADTLVERLTGQAHASDVPVEINLVMGVDTLFGADDEAAELDGHGPIPAGLARSLALDGTASRWLRRLFTAPGTGQLIAMESRRRDFPAGQSRFVRVRDGGCCRTPYCEAPIRHTDHIEPAADGGPTSIDNAQGYCQACNIAKQAAGWVTTRTSSPTEAHEVTITTPTGHQYRSRAPDPPGQAA
jgi:hypothetical protein